MKQEINSRNYWDGRFQADWEENDGPSQSRFFSRVALEGLPQWFLNKVKEDKMSLVDWGCAEGDGTDELKRCFDSDSLTGVDFSEVAVDKARNSYSDIEFLCEDWLAADSDSLRSFDIVFSSNTLEHFYNPKEILVEICKRAKKAVILAIPYREHDRIDEHFYTFSSENIPLTLPNGYKLIWSRVLDVREYKPSFWSGEQVILLYVSDELFSQLDLYLEDNRIETENEKEIAKKAKYALEGVSEKMNQKNLDIERLEKRVGSMEEYIQTIHNSTSWKLTKPLRSVKFVGSLFVRKVRGFFRKIRNRYLSKTKYNCVTWKNFSRCILARRDAYRGVFIIEPSIEWHVDIFQRPQQIAVAMGLQNYLVIYKTLPWEKDIVDGFREVAPNVWLTNKWKEVDQIEDAVRTVYSASYALDVKNIKAVGEKGKVIYEYIDHIDADISGSQRIERLTRIKDFAFSGGVDYIVASARKLYEEAVDSLGEDRVILVQNGVDTSHYRNERNKAVSIPEELSKFNERYGVVVGYFGAIAPWLWYEEISKLAEMRTDMGFVFIGPDYQGGLSQLPDGPNVLCLGSVDYKILPAYASRFDVCFIPFRLGEIARTTSPLKLFEYFALEKPVVVTSEMHECTAYPEVFSGDSAEALSAAIDEAAKVKDDDTFKGRMAQLADENTWIDRAKAMEKVFKN